MTRAPKLARLAELGKCPCLLEGCGAQNVGPRRDQIRKRLARSGPINAGLCGGSRCHSNGANSTSSSQRWEAHYGSNQWLANSDHIGLRKEATEPRPILLITQRINVRSHCLIHVNSQGSVKLFGYSRNIRQTQVVRLHHDGDNSYGHAQSHTTLCLLVNESPVAGTALCILLGLSWVIDRELDVVEGAQFVVFQNSHAVAVGSDGELDGLCAQVGHNCLYLIQRETVRTNRIAVAEGTGKIALVGQPEAERNTTIRWHHA